MEKLFDGEYNRNDLLMDGCLWLHTNFTWNHFPYRGRGPLCSLSAKLSFLRSNHVPQACLKPNETTIRMYLYKSKSFE